MAYRDDRDALVLELDHLQRENQKLKDQLDEANERFRQLAQTRHEQRRVEAARRGCALCGGSLLPVAMFAGHDIGAPLPLSLSTMRFGNPRGGFTHAAAVHSMACASCGFIHNFIDIARAEAGVRAVTADVDTAPYAVPSVEPPRESVAEPHQEPSDEDDEDVPPAADHG